MTILIIMALVVLAIVFAVFFLIFKVIWLIFKKHTNAGPLIAAGICTLICTILASCALYTGYKTVIAPFEGMIANVKANPAPIYGERTYTDEEHTFELTVYDGMDFSKWFTLNDVRLKLGIDTNVFKKSSNGKSQDNPLFVILVHQPNVTSSDPFEKLQEILKSGQEQREVELTDMRPTEVNGLPAYQASGEAYSNRGKKMNFWITAIQGNPTTMYYIGTLAEQNTSHVAEQAQTMNRSFKLLQSSN